MHTQSINIRYVVLAVVLSILFLTGILLLFSTGSDDSSSEDQFTSDEFLQTFEDPVTGETVTNPVDKEPETFSSEEDTITLLGFTELTNRGLSSFQLESFTEVLSLFFATQSYTIREVSLYPEPINPLNISEDAELGGFEFMIRVNRDQDISVMLLLHSLSEVSASFSDANEEIYQSPRINERNNINPDAVE